MDLQTRSIGVGFGALVLIVGVVHPMMPPLIGNTLLVVFGAISLWGFWPAIRAAVRNHRLKTMWPQYLMAFSALGFLIGLVAFLQINVNSHPKDDAKTASNISPPTGLNLDRTIKVTCVNTTRPTRRLEDRSLYTTEILDPRYSAPDMQYANVFSPPGSGDITWDDDVFPKQLLRCTITNYGSTNLFRVSITFSAVFREVVKTATGSSSGNAIATINVKSPEFDLGPARRTEDYFYLANFSNLYVHLSIPSTATVFTSDSDNPIMVKLIPAEFSGVALWPNEARAVPPISPPPTPMPPSTPASK